MTLSSKFSVQDIDPDVSKIITILKINEISDPFKTVDDNQKVVFKIIKLVNKTESHTANLQHDYQKIANIFLSEKKEKTLEEWVNSQQSDNYIRIDETYVNCNFRFSNWLK